MKPEVGDWIKFRSWGEELIAEVTAVTRKEVVVDDRGDCLYVAHGPESILEIRKPNKEKDK